MLIFQINPKELEKNLTANDWLFWNAYISGRVKDNDYVLLPAFIDYIQDTNQPINGENFLIVEDSTDEDGDSEITT